jgi:hypothetical protein
LPTLYLVGPKLINLAIFTENICNFFIKIVNLIDVLN